MCIRGKTLLFRREELGQARACACGEVCRGRRLGRPHVGVDRLEENGLKYPFTRGGRSQPRHGDHLVCYVLVA